MVLKNDDLEILDDDISVSLEGPYPEIVLSDRMQEILDRSMERIVVVRLLGLTIGYRALLNKIQILWKPIGSFQVIDIKNDYYLVKFALGQDYTKSLSEEGLGWSTVITSRLNLGVVTFPRRRSIPLNWECGCGCWDFRAGFTIQKLLRYIAGMLGELLAKDFKSGLNAL
ncbi:hypothetical protein GOBAR_DD14380 [Gossypium barbadense]|nr:hypothetical protein GOBAR_DD14380 [Gossypium barbadense]